MTRPAKGIYYDVSGNITYSGYRPLADPLGVTWQASDALSASERDLLSNNNHEDLIWNGTTLVLNFDSLDRTKEEKITEIKEEAQQQILDLAPEWKQRNMIARAVELVQLGQTTDPEFIAIQAVWDTVKVIRATSDQLEADVNAANTEAGVDAVVWPTT